MFILINTPGKPKEIIFSNAKIKVALMLTKDIILLNCNFK